MKKKNIKTHSKKKKAGALIEKQQFAEARELYQKVCNIDKRDADAWYRLGVVNGMLGDRQECISCLQQAVSLRPNHSLSQYNLGIALRDSGELETAVAAFLTAIRLNADDEKPYKPLAVALMSLKRLDEAEDIFRKLIKLTPHDAEVWGNLGFLLQIMGKLSDAITCCQKAVDMNPSLIAPYANMANIYSNGGEYEKALACYRAALDKDPRNARSHSNLLLALNYFENTDPVDIYQEHRGWEKAHGSALTKLKAYDNDTNEHRVIRLGYISPDFRAHSVASFIEPVLLHHDRSKVEVWCYSSVPHGGDETTVRLKQLAHHWCDISQMSTQQVVNQIRQDKIDILVDLAGHTSSENMLVMAQKPAPVQVTWLGYPNTTGLDAVDYRITDAIADQPGEESFYSEKLVRLDGCFICYQPLDLDIQPGKLPLLENDFITFGSFNNLSKMGDGVIKLWADTVKSVEGSKLFIKNPSLTDEETRDRYLKKFVSHGISDDRISLVGHTINRNEHFKMYDKVDIALDTFPYNGTTTTCEAMWMGVPVITLVGNRHASRVGASLLVAAGFEEQVCEDKESFIRAAQNLAADIDKLSNLRHSLRATLLNSLLCDAERYTRQLESAYSTMWQTRCSSKK